MRWTGLLCGTAGKEIRVVLPPMALPHASLSSLPKCFDYGVCNRVCAHKRNSLHLAWPTCRRHMRKERRPGSPLGREGGGGWQNLGRGGRECTLHNVNLHDAEASESAKDSTYNVHSCV